MLCTKEMLVSPSEEFFSSDKVAENEVLARKKLGHLFKNCQYRKHFCAGGRKDTAWYRKKIEPGF